MSPQPSNLGTENYIQSRVSFSITHLRQIA